jgi:hypothetical protein
MNGDRESERIGAAIRAAAGTVEAPPKLRARVAEERLGEAPRRGTSRRLLPALAGAAAVAAAIAIALVVAGGGGPTISDAAQAALREPTGPAPAKDPRDKRFVRAEIGGVRFPNYTWYAKSWTTVGARRDELSGREALTLVYRGGGKRVGYTIVDGDPLDVPAGARRVSAKGDGYDVFRRGETLIVTWREGGHTCVLASRDLDEDRLVAFATWS